MQEYNNFYSREDISFMGCDPLEHYGIQKRVNDARQHYPYDIEKQREIVENECSYDWPIEIIDPHIIKMAGLQNKTKEAMKDIYKEYNVFLSSSKKCIVKAFYYQGKRWFYWWDMYEYSTRIRSGLEFFPWCDHAVSYLIFATDPNQSPLICSEPFKSIKKE